MINLACLCGGVGELFIALIVLATGGGITAFKVWRSKRRCKHSHKHAA